MIELVEMEIRELLEEMEFILSKGLPSVVLRTRSLSWGWRPSTSSLIEGWRTRPSQTPERGCLITMRLEQGKLKEVVLGYN
jgi:hypothetical protein